MKTQENKTNYSLIGLGDQQATIYVYIENRPPLAFYDELTKVSPLQSGDITSIALHTGNHWRKIFNVYAKLIFELAPQNFSSWQNLRDQTLLQQESNQCLLFSLPNFNKKNQDKIHIIMGRTYAKKIIPLEKCHWLSKDFAINKEYNVIVCPYFDYRQLSNEKIVILAKLIKSFNSSHFNR